MMSLEHHIFMNMQHALSRHLSMTDLSRLSTEHTSTDSVFESDPKPFPRNKLRVTMVTARFLSTLNRGSKRRSRKASWSPPSTTATNSTAQDSTVVKSQRIEEREKKKAGCGKTLPKENALLNLCVYTACP